MGKLKRTPIEKPEPPKFDWVVFKEHWSRSILIGIGSGLVFMLLIYLVYFIRYGQIADWAFFKGYGLFLMIVGIITIAWKQYWFGGIFLSFSVVGFLVNCVVNYQESLIGQPTMAGGFANLIILFIGFVSAVVVQLVVRKLRLKNERAIEMINIK